jgi:hypothetical protein
VLKTKATIFLSICYYCGNLRVSGNYKLKIMAVKKKSIWLSYDFGLKGNYSALFTFLDNHEAIDCGNGLAYFKYNNDESLKSEELIDKLKKELAEAILPTTNDRIYVIWRDDDKPFTANVKGKFLFGSRKTPAWNGYATKQGENQEDEAI